MGVDHPQHEQAAERRASAGTERPHPRLHPHYVPQKILPAPSLEQVQSKLGYFHRFSRECGRDAKRELIRREFTRSGFHFTHLKKRIKIFNLKGGALKSHYLIVI